MRKNVKKHEIDPLPIIPAIPSIPPDFKPDSLKEISNDPIPEILPVIRPEIDETKEDK
ncbi:MAG: hypothetical protein RI883_849 [Bacteroidota bacterium]|jgi:hypothetical protein